jgi:SAM-dependent methyltransferase
MSTAIWQEVECGSYAADLALWEELAREAAGPVLDLGCGTGRVSLHLARRGVPVIGLDADPELVATLAGRADGLPVHAIHGDARGFALDAAVDLILAPMQLLQLLPGPEGRRELLESVAAHLAPGGLVAMAIVEAVPSSAGAAAPLPDVREVDDWVYSSLPLETTVEGGEIALRRLRQAVSPDGALVEERNETRLRALTAGQLEREGAAAGLVPRGRREIPATDLHVGSTVVLLGREG